jgi:DNA-binding GntR family transcriptional regulator
MKKSEFVTQDLLSKVYQRSGKTLNKLPPERQLAEIYGVSRFTIRQALVLSFVLTTLLVREKS